MEEDHQQQHLDVGSEWEGGDKNIEGTEPLIDEPLENDHIGAGGDYSGTKGNVKADGVKNRKGSPTEALEKEVTEIRKATTSEAAVRLEQHLNDMKAATKKMLNEINVYLK